MLSLLKIIDFFLHPSQKNNPPNTPYMQRASILILSLGSISCLILAINSFGELPRVSNQLFISSMIGFLGLFLFKVIANDKIVLRLMLGFYTFVHISTTHILVSILNAGLVWGLVITATSVLVGGYIFGFSIAVIYTIYFTYTYHFHNAEMVELLYSPERLNVIYFDLLISLIVIFIICTIARIALRKAEIDINLLKNKEAHSQSKMQFLTNMSHEFRTPMNGILGVTELMAEEANKEQLQNLKLIQKSANNLLRTLSDILDISKAEHNLLDLSYDLFDPNRVIQECIDTMDIAAIDKGLSINFSQKSSETSIKGDELRLKQILLNLIGNAIKFTDKGEVEIKCEVLYKNKRDITLGFSVKDTGIGIFDNDKPYVFDFLTNKHHVDNKLGGSGLGLVVCQKLIQAQKGTITFESKARQGTTFSFELPYTIN